MQSCATFGTENEMNVHVLVCHQWLVVFHHWCSLKDKEEKKTTQVVQSLHALVHAGWYHVEHLKQNNYWRVQPPIV